VATPFVQGHLLQKELSVTIRSACGHCGRPIRMEVSSDLTFSVEEGATPLVFEPAVDWCSFTDPTIIDGY
jgi:hypothetical protein